MDTGKSLRNYLSELDNTWQAAYGKTRQQIEANETPTSLTDCIHNALLRSSLNTFAENLTPAIVARLFETGLWTIEDILSLISIIPENYRKAQNYVAILETGKLDTALTIKVRDDALETANAIDFPTYRSQMLEELSKFSNSDNKIADLEKAVDAHISSADGMFGDNAFSLCRLIETLSDSMLASTEQKVLALKNSEARAWALAFLAHRTTGDHQYQLLKQGLEAASQIKSDVNIGNALAQLNYQLSGELVSKALELALSLTEGNWRPRAIAGLTNKIDETQLKRVLESILTIEDDWWRADGLISVIGDSSGETQMRALQNLLSIEYGEPYSKVISWINRYSITPNTLTTAIHAADKIENEQHRSEILQHLNQAMQNNQERDQILDIADLEERANAFLAKAEQSLGDTLSNEILNAWTTIETIEDKTIQNELRIKFDSLTQRRNQATPREMIDAQELEEIFQIQWEEDRANKLMSVASSIPDELLAQVVDRSKRFLSWLHRDTVLDRLAPRLTGELLTSATQDVADYEDTVSLAHALQDLAKYLSQPQKNVFYSYALDLLLAENSPKWGAEEVLKLRADLDGELREKATAHLPEELRNITYEELMAQKHAANLRYYEENPERKKEFDEMMETARKLYAPQQITLPQIVQPITSLKFPDANQKLYDDRMDFLTFLGEARFKKRESVFWLFRNISTLFKENEPSTQIISAIATDILEIHKNWHWPQ